MPRGAQSQSAAGYPGRVAEEGAAQSAWPTASCPRPRDGQQMAPPVPKQDRLRHLEPKDVGMPIPGSLKPGNPLDKGWAGGRGGATLSRDAPGSLWKEAAR